LHFGLFTWFSRPSPSIGGAARVQFAEGLL
jgi:hypothetical protein